MNILQIGIIVFTFIEFLNIMILYFNPTSTMGNGVGVFKDYSGTDFEKYMVNWVAGAKLIFIMLGIVIVIFGNHMTQLFTCLALIISIGSFYFRLNPLIKKMDAEDKISPKGYSKTLNYMILFFIIGFIVVFVLGM